MSATGILQTAAVIAKTTQTQVGDVLGVEWYENLTLFVDYVKGDETGVDIQVHFLRSPTGTAYQESLWSETGGVYTREPVEYNLTASANVTIPVYVWGVDYVRITQGGSNNDGTPTGTLAVAYTME